MILGCIGDDFTGSSDLGLTLANGGMQVTQYCGVPTGAANPSVDAGVVALKTRTCPVDTAVSDSLAALRWLRDQGCRRYFFKYCSTFDSTPEGNIGPVIDALMSELNARRALVCPAFPANGRSVYMGHLFVGDTLLSDSGMRDHPLTPMRDSDIRRWLAQQTCQSVGHVPHSIVSQGRDAIRTALEAEGTAGRPIIVVDAISDADLREIGLGLSEDTLITGGSGIGLGLPESFGSRGQGRAGEWHGFSGPGAVLSGSCSSMTRAQVGRYAMAHPALAIDPVQILSGAQTADTVADWLIERLEVAPIAYSTADPKSVAAAQASLGREKSANLIESLFGVVAQRLRDAGAKRLVVAGGETSGAVVSALGLSELRIGPEIAPGVPAMSDGAGGLSLALKSGNFGDTDFFETALTVLEGGI